MLIRGVVLAVSACVACSTLVGVAVADASIPPAPPPIVVSGDNHDGSINTTVTAAGAPGGVARPVGSRTSHAAGGVTCTWTVEGLPLSASVVVDGPQGTWFDVSCSDGSTVPIGVFVPAGSGNVPAASVRAGDLAQSAASQLPLPQPQAGRSPAGQALVGLPTWFWIDPGQWRALRQRTVAGPVWAQVVATPVSTSWDLGDGSPVLSCAGPGTPYDRTRPETAQATNCAYSYPRSSAQQPQTGLFVNDRFFTVTVTTTWQVSWTGSGGSGGTLPVLTRSRSFPLAVAQRQTVVTGGSG